MSNTKKPAWLKDIKVIVWDVDGTFYNFKAVPQYEKVYYRLFFQKLQSIWKLPLTAVKKKYLVRRKKLGGDTITLNSFGIKGISFFEQQIYKKIDFNKLLPADKKLAIMIRKLKFLKQAIMSNNSLIVLKRKLKALGVSDKLFDWLISSFDHGFFKPDIKAFQLILKTTNLPAKNHLYIGDSKIKDIIPAKKVGFRTCLVWEKSKEADISLRTVYEVVRLF